MCFQLCFVFFASRGLWKNSGREKNRRAESRTFPPGPPTCRCSFGHGVAQQLENPPTPHSTSSCCATGRNPFDCQRERSSARVVKIGSGTEGKTGSVWSTTPSNNHGYVDGMAPWMTIFLYKQVVAQLHCLIVVRPCCDDFALQEGFSPNRTVTRSGKDMECFPHSNRSVGSLTPDCSWQA